MFWGVGRGRLQMMVLILGSLLSTRMGWNPQLLYATWPSPHCGGYAGSEAVDGSSLSSCVSVKSEHKMLSRKRTCGHRQRNRTPRICSKEVKTQAKDFPSSRKVSLRKANTPTSEVSGFPSPPLPAVRLQSQARAHGRHVFEESG